MPMLSTQDLSSEELETLRRSRTTHNGGNGQWRSANKRGSTGTCSRSLRNSANEWVSGKQPRLTKKAKTILCKTENFVPMVVPGLSSSSSTSPSQDSSSTSTSTSSAPASERSDELAPGNWSRNPARDSENSNDRLRDLPERLEEFTENLEDTEVRAPAHISHDSDSERPTKVVSRKHRIFMHFQKAEIAKSACEPR